MDAVTQPHHTSIFHCI